MIACNRELHKRLAFAAVLLAAAMASSQALADSTQIETVVVTAEKRPENIQEVPLSVTAINGDELLRNHIVNIQDLKLVDPSVQFRVSNASTNSAFSIRGVGTSTFSVGIEQSVSTVVDGVVLQDPTSIVTLADIDHIEILKGPQGMLFGKNASAGLINIITKDPQFDSYEAIFHVSYGINDEQQVQAIFNLPLADDLALRVSLSRNHLAGWARDPVYNDRRINSINDNGVRAKLLWEPNADLKVTLAGDYNYNGQPCCSQFVRTTPNPLSGIAVSDAMYGVVAGPNNFQVTDGALPFSANRTEGGSLTIDYNLGADYSLTSISSYRTEFRANSYDADFSVFDFVDVNGGHIKLSNYSEEIRLSSPLNIVSPLGGSFDYVAGAYYSGYNALGTIGDQIGYFIPPNLGTVTIPTTSLLATDSGITKVDSQDFALFAQGRYHLSQWMDGLDLILGARFTRDDMRIYDGAGPNVWGTYNGVLVASGPITPGTLNYLTGVNGANLPLRSGNSYVGYSGPFIGTVNGAGGAGGVPPPGSTLASVGCVAGSTLPIPAAANCFPAIQQSTGASNFSYRVTLEEQFNPTVMGYLTAARGYKGPGLSGSSSPNRSTFVNAGGVQPYDTSPAYLDQSIKPEIPQTEEIGFKSLLFDGVVLLNADVFMTDTKNFQTQITTPTQNGFVAHVANAGALHTSGLELNTEWNPIENLSLTASGALIRGVYGNFPGVSCYFTTSALTVVNGLVVGPATPTGGTGCGTTVPNGSGGFVAGQLNAQGMRLTNLPSFQYNLGATYDAPNLLYSLTGHFHVSWAWQGNVQYNANGDPGEIQKSFGLLGGEIGIGTDDDKYRFSLYGTNILNTHWASGINVAPTQSINPGGLYQYFGPDAFAHYGFRLDIQI